MRLLLKAAFQNRKHFLLLIFTAISMLAMTVTSQMEIFALGVLTNAGPDAFTLFAPEVNGKLAPQESLSIDQVQKKWEVLDPDQTGSVTKAQVAHYMGTVRDPNLLGQLIRSINDKLNLHGSIWVLVGVLLCVSLFKAIALFGSRFFTELVSIRVSRDLRQRYFEHIQKLPMSFYQKHNIGGISSRVVGDATLVATSINATLMNYLQAPFIALSTLILCFYISWQLSMIIFIGLPLVFFPIVYVAQRIKLVSKHMQKNQEGFTSVLVDFLAGIQTVKIFATEDFSLKKYKEQNDKMAYLEAKSARYSCIARPILHFVGGIFLAAILLYGIFVAQMTISSLIVYCGLLYQFYEPIKKFGEENSQIQRGVVAAERMFEVLNEEPDIKDNSNAIALQGAIETIEFQDVWFKYENEWILKGVSFKIDKGQTIAIVGPTGSGKSTIASLLPRLYDVQRGMILINDKPLNFYSQKSLREHLAYVSQKPFLFLDSIKENLTFGRSFSDAEVLSAAERAHATEFIHAMPQKYETKLAESGKNLSGGQQQRLAIARALLFLKKAPVLIMDEATSALDAMSEHHIKEVLQDLKGSVTQIVIAHRLSTIEHADKVIYLDKGVKVAEGTREELMNICPNFRRMWEMMMLAPAGQVET